MLSFLHTHPTVCVSALSVWRHKPAPYFFHIFHFSFMKLRQPHYISRRLYNSANTLHTAVHCEIAQPTFMNEIRGKKMCVFFSFLQKSAARVPRVSLIGVITQDYQLVERERFHSRFDAGKCNTFYKLRSTSWLDAECKGVSAHKKTLFFWHSIPSQKRERDSKNRATKNREFLSSSFGR